MRKPRWLHKKIDLSTHSRLKRLLRRCNLHSVCEEASCPNISECFSNGVATFLILGDTCTRTCRFCGVKKGVPDAPDTDEPGRVKRAIESLKLSHVVITSPTRDDLTDGGAKIFAQTIKLLRGTENIRCIEVLIPDFKGNEAALKEVIDAGCDIIAHNIETVPSLYSRVRCGANYERSCRVLAHIKEYNPKLLTKSGLMLGLGETDEEVETVLRDLRKVNCDFLSIGQYLAPSQRHYPALYVRPEKFKRWEEVALTLGFKNVKSGPYVRSSYLADTYMKED